MDTVNPYKIDGQGSKSLRRTRSRGVLGLRHTIKVQVYVHGAPTVIDYNLTLNRIFRLKKFRSGHPAMQEFFNPPSSCLTIQTLVQCKKKLCPPDCLVSFNSYLCKEDVVLCEFRFVNSMV